MQVHTFMFGSIAVHKLCKFMPITYASFVSYASLNEIHMQVIGYVILCHDP